MLASSQVTPDQWDEWKRLDFEPKQVVRLAGRGLDWSKRLRDLELAPAAIVEVADRDLDPIVARSFIALGVPATAIWKYLNAEMSPDDLGEYVRVGFRPDIARDWFQDGLDAPSATRWSKFGLTSRECARLADAGVEPELSDIELRYRSEIAHGNDDANRILGAVLLAADRPADAVEPLERAAESGLGAHGLLGEAYFRLGRTEDAERSWETAADAFDGWSMVRLGMVHEERGELDLAESWYLRGAQANDTWAMVRLGRLVQQLGRPADAETWFEKAAWRGDPDGESELISLLRSQGRDEEAQAQERKASDGQSSSSVPYADRLL